MKKKNGIEYKTVDDIGKELGVSASTIRRYIRNGTFPKPRRVFFGQQGIQVFSDEYIARAKVTLENLRG